MKTLASEVVPIDDEADIAVVRALVRARGVELGLGALALTMILTAASELARNTLLHGGGGTVVVATVADGERRGIHLAFEDHGAGIADLTQAMTDGFTTGRGMGLGLGGSRRLVDELTIVSRVGEGTRVTVTKWT